MKTKQDYDPDGVAADRAKLTASEPLVIGLIQRSPTNPRKHFPEDAHAELVESVRRHGVLQPILVRLWPANQKWVGDIMPSYEIVAGERRFRAAIAAGFTVIPGIVRNLTDLEVLEIQIVENLQRAELHPLEEAEGYELLMKKHGYTAEDLGAKVGKSKAYIYARLKLTALCKSAREAFYAGDLTPSTALLVARIPVPALQERATKAIGGSSPRGPLSAREAADYVHRTFMLRLSDAPFPRADKDLLPGVPKCHECPKRTGNQPELFEDVASADVCTDPDCFGAKRKAHFERVKKEARADGRKVLVGKEAKKIAPYGTHNLKDGYISLDDRCFDVAPDKSRIYPTYRQLLGKDYKAPALIEDADSGNLVEIVKKPDLVSALKAKGVELKRPASSGASQEEKERERKAKIESNARQEIFEQVREKTIGYGISLEIIRLVAAAFFHSLGWELSKRVLRLWLEDFKDKDAWEVGKKFDETIRIMEVDDLVPLLVDMSLVGELAVHAYGDPDKKPEFLHAAAAIHGIDAGAIRKGVIAEAKAKEAEKAKKKSKSASKLPADGVALKAKVGDSVRIKEGLRGPNGHLRKCCGRTGVVASIDGDAITVRCGPRAHETVANLAPVDLERVSA